MTSGHWLGADLSPRRLPWRYPLWERRPDTSYGSNQGSAKELRLSIPNSVRLQADQYSNSPASRALASRFPGAILAGRLMVFETTVYLRRERLAVLAAVDMRLT